MTAQWFGEYEIIKQLRVGGMATLYLARRHGAEGFSRLVALKMIHPHLVAQPNFIEMFVDEARICSHISHPNVVHVEEFGVLDGVHYLVMEYLDGCSVSELLQLFCRERRTLDPELAARVIMQVAGGLHAAHKTCGPDGQPLDLIHRDISPSNVLISVDGNAKLIDFGIAKARNRASETQAGITLKSKYRYVAPEQALHAVVDRRCDIFSLGIVFWEMVTNERAFKRDADFDTLRAVVKDMPALPSSIVPSLPKGVDDIIMRCLAKDPDERYQNIAELIDDVEALAETAGISLTAGVLRRHMKELFGTRPEPWQTLEGDHDVGLPLDVDAEDVPLLPLTGLIDVSMLIQRDELGGPTPHRIPVGLLKHHDTKDLRPRRIPTGSVPMVPIEELLERDEPSTVIPVVPIDDVLARFSAEPSVVAPAMDGTGVVLVPPRIAIAPAPQPKRRVWLIALIAVSTVALAMVIYVVAGRGNSTTTEPPRVIAPAAPPAPVERPKPTATPIDVPAPAVVAPVEPEKPVAKPVAPPVIAKPRAVEIAKPKAEPVKTEPPPKPEPKPETKTKPECDDPMRCQFY
jgi:serine/threonine-protein kinase